jgi:hypothetical protein
LTVPLVETVRVTLPRVTGAVVYAMGCARCRESVIEPPIAIAAKASPAIRAGRRQERAALRVILCDAGGVPMPSVSSVASSFIGCFGCVDPATLNR